MSLAETPRLRATFTGIRWPRGLSRWISPLILLVLWEILKPSR